MGKVYEDWEFTLDLDSKEAISDCEFEKAFSTFKENICKLELRPGNEKCPDKNKNEHEKLKELVDKNKLQRNEMNLKLEEFSRKQLQYENYKKGRNLISQEIKDRHEAFLMAKKYYKKFLNIYLTVESKSGETQKIFFQFFTETKIESETYSVRLLRNTKKQEYQLISTTPKLHNLKELQKILLETKDVPGAICTIRHCFIAMRNNKDSF